MAQDQSLHQGLHSHSQDLRGRSYPQPQSAPRYNSYISGSINSLENSMSVGSMPQASMQNSSSSTRPMNQAMWQFQQVGAQNFDGNTIETANYGSSDLAYSNGNFWGSSAGYGSPVSWSNNLSAEPFIVPEFESSFNMKSDYKYDHTSAKGSLDNGSIDYHGQPLQMPSGLNGVLQGQSMNQPSSDSSNSNSPKSYLSDFLESEMSLFSPSSVPDQATPGSQWNHYHTPIIDAKSSPQSSLLSPFSTPNPALQNVHGSFDSDFTGLPRASSKFSAYPTAPTNGNQPSNPSMMSFGGTQTNLPSSADPYDSDPTLTSWYLPGYSHDTSGLLYIPVQPPRGGTLRSMLPEGSSISNQYKSAGAAQDNLRDRMNIPGSGVTQSQRKFNDEILVQGKKNGLTYKDIREQMLGEKPAESTLRGRYRALTKAKKDRVRKPMWKKRDIELLDECVEQEFNRIENTFPNPHSFSLQQKLNKVAWKKVADFIHSRGGSYQFGNSTCKRKWLEVHAS